MADEIKKIKYKAVYMPKGMEPFHPRLSFLTRTAEVEASAPLEQVEAWAREMSEGNRFIRVEVVS